MKKVIYFILTGFIFTSCVTTSKIQHKVNEHDILKSKSTSGLIRTGPLGGIPNETLESIEKDIASGKCKQTDTVYTTVLTKTFMSIPLGETGSYECKP